MNNTLLIFSVGLGGFFGAVSRFVIGEIVQRFQIADQVSSGTFIANILGSFLMGILFFLLTFKLNLSDNLSTQVNAFLGIGFLGSLTTFSTFSLESYKILNEGNVILFFAHAGAHFLCCLLAVCSGVFLTKILFA